MAKRTMLFGKAALTCIRLTDGRMANIAAGRAVPENIDDVDAARLLDEGFLVEVELVDDLLDVPEADLDREGRLGATTATGLPLGLTADGTLTDGTTPATDPETGEVVLEPAGVAFTEEELDELLPKKADDILDAVGDDDVKARQVMNAETAAATAAGKEPRKNLAAGLQDVLDAAELERQEASA